MSTAKHSPGPWEVWIPPMRNDVIHIKSDARFVASVNGMNTRTFRFSAEEHANSDLIAAAPELLAALSAMLAMFEESHSGDEVVNDHGGDGPSGCSYCRTIDQARAVLSKVLP